MTARSPKAEARDLKSRKCSFESSRAEKFCKCWSKDPKCKRCGKPQRLCENWHQKMDMTYERRKHVTKKQKAALQKLVEVFSSKPIHELIDMKKFRSHFGKVARAQLRANKIPTKGLTGEDCIQLSIQHSRAFLGMDKPNVFTGVK